MRSFHSVFFSMGRVNSRKCTFRFTQRLLICYKIPPGRRWLHLQASRGSRRRRRRGRSLHSAEQGKGKGAFLVEHRFTVEFQCCRHSSPHFTTTRTLQSRTSACSYRGGSRHGSNILLLVSGTTVLLVVHRLCYWVVVGLLQSACKFDASKCNKNRAFIARINQSRICTGYRSTVSSIDQSCGPEASYPVPCPPSLWPRHPLR